MLYMCAKLGQCGAIRGNVKQLRMSAYVTLTVTQSTSRRSKQWNNILVHGCQNRGPGVWFFLPFLWFFWLSCVLSAANVTERVSHQSCLGSPQCHTAGQRKDSSLHLLSIGGPMSKSNAFEVTGNGFNDLTSKWVHYRIHLHLEYIHALHQK